MGKIEWRPVRSMADRHTVLDLYQGAAEYFRNNGDPYPDRAMVEHDRTARPDNVPADQKHFGILQLAGANIGVLDLLDGYPDAQTVYIGLLLLPAQYQHQGLGTRVVTGLAQHFAAAGRRQLRVAVVTTNQAVRSFWLERGFQVVGQSRAALTPRNIQTVDVMDLSLK
ncbi:GNAT family N-acetyltransferase [Lacticaseibacillus thailandensis]|uniref:N-acetyltransferase domain-containing protein n=1 Tax=Lacticaseibacillus thailandensis DSM 22698 = JCM 13996 TaxID=1423810 RepID=A0A0R2CGB5_9LACO|nr:GNAT family N-acetyltransferase [Lacticaseibacillus thailandensis]KRM87403.1 hypothetical protein FD19_GL000906 [Lacticaseibacillus thailandensis DSM 22698 = JCM 13996]